MGSDTVTSLTITEKKSTYATETQWRDYTQLLDTTEFPSSLIASKLVEATAKLKRDAFISTRLEFVTKDSNDRYFMRRRWMANAYGTEVAHGVVTPRDFRIWEADETSSVSTAMFLQGSRINRLIYEIPQEAITLIDSTNGFFKLSSDYPTASRRVFIDYWTVGKRLSEIGTELEEACICWTTVLILTQFKKTSRMKNGVVSLSQGGRTIQRNEQDFDSFTRQWYNEYHSKVNWLRPQYIRSVKWGGYAERTSRYGFAENKINYY